MGRPQDLLIFLQPLRPALLLTAVVLGGILFSSQREKLVECFALAETKRYLAFYAIMIIGIPFAYHRGVAFEFVLVRYLPNILFFLVLTSQIDSLRKLKSLVFTISVSILLLSVLGYAFGGVYEGRFGIHGSAFDPNDLAYVLVSLSPLSLFYLQGNQSLVVKCFGLTTFGASVSLMLLTGSRGGLVAFGAMFLLLLVSGVGGLKLKHKVLSVMLLGAVLLFLGDKVNTERYLTLSEIGSDYNIDDEFGRMVIWERGLDMILANPLTGVGVDCFAMALGYMRESLGLIPKWQVAHNSLVQVAAEIGVVGFVLFVVINLKSLATFARTSKLAVVSEESRDLRFLATMMLLGFVGHFVAANFLTQGYSIYFTLFFALAAIVRKLLDSLVPAASDRLKPR